MLFFSANKVLVAESSKGGMGSVVAPPKFVFGQKMPDRVKEEKDHSFGENKSDEKPRCSEKRSVESDEEDDNPFSKEQEGCLSPVKKMAKTEESFKPEEEGTKNFKLLKPSILNEVAKNLTGGPSGERKVVTSPIPKTFGLTTDTSSTEDSSSRPHSFAGELKGTSENIFQQILAGGSKASSSSASSGFLFGQNMSQRVVITKNGNTNKQVNSTKKSDDDSSLESENASSSVDEETKNEDSSSEIQSETSVTLLDQDPKSLAEVAKHACDAEGPQSPDKNKPHHTLAEAAMAYDKEHVAPSRAEQLNKITVVTGEEEERNVLQINCRLFIFDLANHSWREKGRGILKLNDMCTSSTEGIFQSRLVVRTQGNLRVVLNTKLWPQMTVEKANEKSLRVTALDTDSSDIKIYLIMAAPKEIQQLCTAIDRRIEALKRSQKPLDKQLSTKQAGDAEEDRSEHGDETKVTGADDDDDDSQKDLETSRRPVQVDESSNESCPQEPVRQLSTNQNIATDED